MQVINMHANESKFHRGSWLVTMPLVAIAVIHITFVFFPCRKAIRQLRMDIEYAQLFIGNGGNVSAKLVAAQKDLLEAKSYIEKWRREVFSVHRLPTIFGNINALSKQSGTAITRFEPQAFIELGLIRQVPVHMACTGTIAQIHEFIRSLENLPQTIWLDTLKFQKSGQNGDITVCEINLVAFSDNPKNSNYADISK
jgi:Tfp pilus assembly protein PilO